MKKLKLRGEHKNLDDLIIVMLKNNDTIKSLSKYLEMNEKSLSARLNGKLDFKAREILKISQKYKLKPEEIIYFFNLKSTL